MIDHAGHAHRDGDEGERIEGVGRAGAGSQRGVRIVAVGQRVFAHIVQAQVTPVHEFPRRWVELPIFAKNEEIIRAGLKHAVRHVIGVEGVVSSGVGLHHVEQRSGGVVERDIDAPQTIFAGILNAIGIRIEPDGAARFGQRGAHTDDHEVAHAVRLAKGTVGVIRIGAVERVTGIAYRTVDVIEPVDAAGEELRAEGIEGGGSHFLRTGIARQSTQRSFGVGYGGEEIKLILVVVLTAARSLCVTGSGGGHATRSGVAFQRPAEGSGHVRHRAENVAAARAREEGRGAGQGIVTEAELVPGAVHQPEDHRTVDVEHEVRQRGLRINDEFGVGAGVADRRNGRSRQPGEPAGIVHASGAVLPTGVGDVAALVVERKIEDRCGVERAVGPAVDVGAQIGRRTARTRIADAADVEIAPVVGQGEGTPRAVGTARIGNGNFGGGGRRIGIEAHQGFVEEIDGVEHPVVGAILHLPQRFGEDALVDVGVVAGSVESIGQPAHGVAHDAADVHAEGFQIGELRQSAAVQVVGVDATRAERSQSDVAFGEGTQIDDLTLPVEGDAVDGAGLFGGHEVVGLQVTGSIPGEADEDVFADLLRAGRERVAVDETGRHHGGRLGVVAEVVWVRVRSVHIAGTGNGELHLGAVVRAEGSVEVGEVSGREKFDAVVGPGESAEGIIAVLIGQDAVEQHGSSAARVAAEEVDFDAANARRLVVGAVVVEVPEGASTDHIGGDGAGHHEERLVGGLGTPGSVQLGFHPKFTQA